MIIILTGREVQLNFPFNYVPNSAKTINNSIVSSEDAMDLNMSVHDTTHTDSEEITIDNGKFFVFYIPYIFTQHYFTVKLIQIKCIQKNYAAEF